MDRRVRDLRDELIQPYLLTDEDRMWREENKLKGEKGKNKALTTILGQTRKFILGISHAIPYIPLRSLPYHHPTLCSLSFLYPCRASQGGYWRKWWCSKISRFTLFWKPVSDSLSLCSSSPALHLTVIRPLIGIRPLVGCPCILLSPKPLKLGNMVRFSFTASLNLGL